MAKVTPLMVLADEETWTELDGCKIILVPDEQLREARQAEYKATDFSPVLAIGLEQLVEY